MKKLIYISLIFIIAFTGCTKNIEPSNNKSKITEDFIKETAVFDAIRAKDNVLVSELIQKGADISSKDKYGYTPLHIATRLNQYKTVEELIDNGATVNTVDVFGDTPLLDSTRNSTNPMSKLLICNGATKNVKDRHDMTPLHNSSKNGDIFISKLLENNNTTKMCEKLDITLTTYDNNKICGDIPSGVATSVNVTIADQNEESMKPFGPYSAIISDNKYCANVDKKLIKGNKYIVTAIGDNSVEQDIEIANLDDLRVKITQPIKNEIVAEEYIEGLYEALMTEFGSDFDTWNAQLDKNGLVFRFKDPADLFDHGSSKLSKNYKVILDNFFPRYLKVLNEYKDQIEQVRVEGHTSSVYKSAKSDKQRYSKNLKLSTARAVKVYNYTLKNKKTKNLSWFKKNYKPVGMAYDNLILDENGVEDQPASRRVEFRINKKIN